MSRFSHNLLSVSYLVCVSSVFIIDIADKLLGRDWTGLMSCRCESRQMKMGFFVSVRQRRRQTDGDKWEASSIV